MQDIKLKKIIIVTAVIVVMIVIALFYYPLRSYLIMSIYSTYNNTTSVMKQQGFDIHIPGGAFTSQKDWYPFVNIFDTSQGFSNYIDEDVSLSVLYNFGAFEGKSSSLYDENSKYFGAFYGAYVVKNNISKKEPYGFKDNKLDINQIINAAKYDYKYLVIRDFGCLEPIFDVISYDIQENISYIGYNDWVKIDAEMITNSTAHTYKKHLTPYLQYGVPKKTNKEDFYEIILKGRMYARYFEKHDTTIVIYVMGTSSQMIDECDNEILAHITIK